MQIKKQIFSLITVLLIIGISIFSVVSCTKTEQVKENTNGTISYFSPAEEMVEPTIAKFIHRHNDYKAGFKSGAEDIKLGEAVWTLEAGANYEFQGPKDDLGDFVTDSMTVMVNVYVGDDNEYYVSETDAMDLYDDVVAYTGNAVAKEGTKLIATDLIASSVVNGQVEMKVVTVSGKGSSNPCAINNTDYWYAGAEAGKCDIYAGQYIGKDAGNRINQQLNCALLNVGYWTDISNTGYVTNYYDANNDPCFWGMDMNGNWNDCLSPQNITYWIGQAEYVIGDKKPTGKEFIDCRFVSDNIVGNNAWFHIFENIRYGIPHEGNPT